MRKTETQFFEPDEDGGGYSFGHILEFAESIGWVDPFLESDEYLPRTADATEASAMDFIKSAGYIVRD